ncbi:hypothetical protein USB125703_01710 [Pseudoclavibacter triregionum]|nr:hypothetical protein USB125703_01710 [Pseudoclavibacter triregionum]
MGRRGMAVGARSGDPSGGLPLEVCGWRIVRRLAPEPGRRRLLACLGAPPAEDSWRVAGAAGLGGLVLGPSGRRVEPGELVELVLDDAGPEELPLAAELALLERLERSGGPLAAAAETLDTSADASGRTVVVRPRSEPLADAVLAGEEGLVPGQLVTLLAPLAELLVRLHGAGWAHGSVTLGSLAVEDGGRPVLGGWHAAGEPEPSRAAQARAADWRGLARAARALGGASLEGAGRVSGLLDRCERGQGDAELGEALVDALFEWAPAEPLPDGGTAASRPPGPLTGGFETAGFDVPSAGASIFAALADASDLGDEEPLHRAAEEAGEMPQRTTDTVRRRVLSAFADAREKASARQSGESRARGWPPARQTALAAVGVLALGAAAVLGLGAAARGGPPAVAAESTSTSAEAGSASAEVSSAPAEAGGVGAAATAAPSPDDPLAALTGLLACRERALAESDARALAGCYASGAPGLERDLARLAVGGGVAGDPPGSSWRLVDRLGGVAVLERSDGLLVTLSQGEDGWRLRDLREPGR